MQSRIVSVALLSLVGCDGNDGGNRFAPPPPSMPPADEALGGIWQGTDSNAKAVLALSTETGRFHLINDDAEQGFGAMSSSGTELTIDYTLVPALDETLIDGSLFADCRATGTIRERQSLTLTTECITEFETVLTASALLTFNNLYDRNSSLATIAGTYNDFGSILTIDSNGVMFEQDPLTNCVLNGLVDIIDEEFNAYNIAFEISGCGPATDFLNGSRFSGIATLDNTGNPESLIAGLTGEVEDITVARTLQALSLDP
jgi:hypothetical protein